MTVERKVCRIHLTAGRVEPCPGAACPFWELADLDADEGCALERLELDLARPDLASYLLELREALEEARFQKELEAARESFPGLIPPDLSGR